MSTTATVSENLRVLADMIEAHPDLPLPFISAYSTGNIDAAWYLHIHDLAENLPEQKAVAARIVSTLGGKWDKVQGEDFRFTQKRAEKLSLEVVVNRAAVCERVVTGSHEVTMPATPARRAEPGRVETVEDVTWICSSLLAEPAKPDRPATCQGQNGLCGNDETLERVGDLTLCERCRNVPVDLVVTGGIIPDPQSMFAGGVFR